MNKIVLCGFIFYRSPGTDGEWKGGIQAGQDPGVLEERGRPTRLEEQTDVCKALGPGH